MVSISSTDAVAAIGVTTLATVVDSALGAQVTFILLVLAGSAIGGAGGGISSDMRGGQLAIRILVAFFAGIFSAFFQLVEFVKIPPAMLSAVIAFIAVEPKKNLDGLAQLVDRVRGIKAGGEK